MALIHSLSETLCTLMRQAHAQLLGHRVCKPESLASWSLQSPEIFQSSMSPSGHIHSHRATPSSEPSIKGRWPVPRAETISAAPPPPSPSLLSRAGQKHLVGTAAPQPSCALLSPSLPASLVPARGWSQVSGLTLSFVDLLYP